jgi:hypothetical protein
MKDGAIVSIGEVGGLHHRYERVAGLPRGAQAACIKVDLPVLTRISLSLDASVPPVSPQCFRQTLLDQLSERRVQSARWFRAATVPCAGALSDACLRRDGRTPVTNVGKMADGVA